MRISDDLLEYVCAGAGLEYLSDLKFLSSSPENKLRFLETVENIDAGGFPAAQWNELCRYVTGGVSAFESPFEARRYLLEKVD